MSNVTTIAVSSTINFEDTLSALERLADRMIAIEVSVFQLKRLELVYTHLSEMKKVDEVGKRLDR